MLTCWDEAKNLRNRCTKSKFTFHRKTCKKLFSCTIALVSLLKQELSTNLDSERFENGPNFGSWGLGNLAGWVWGISEGQYAVASCHSPTRMSMWRNQNKKDQDLPDYQIKKASNFWSKKPVVRWRRRSQVARSGGNLCQSRMGWMFWLVKFEDRSVYKLDCGDFPKVQIQFESVWKCQPFHHLSSNNTKSYWSYIRITCSMGLWEKQNLIENRGCINCVFGSYDFLP